MTERNLFALICFCCWTFISDAQTIQVVEEKITLRDIYGEKSAKKEASLAAKRFHLTAAQTIKWEDAAKRRRELNAPYLEKLKRSPSLQEERVIRVQIRRNQDHFYEEIAAHLTPLQQREMDLEKGAHHEVRKTGPDADSNLKTGRDE